ncbi:MAG: hypothetical protein ACOYN0_03230, partial [Phycisphaerales bacterium]
AHYVYDFMQAHEDYCPRRPAPIGASRAARETRYFEGCRIAVRFDGEGGYHAVSNLSKGGVVKVFDSEGPIASDTGLIGRLGDGKVVVSHLVKNDARIERSADGRVFTVTTPLCYRRHKLPSPITNIIFRAGMITVGRFNANLVRSTLQKVLITGKSATPWMVSRRIEFRDGEVVVEDRVPVDCPLTELAAGSDATSIYVANSNVFQESVLCPWHWCDVTKLPVEGGERVWRRVYRRERSGAGGGGA